jgi:G3E family GTPase
MPAPPTRRRLRLPVPTLILTGALAAGKTTFVGNLLQSKPPAEVWAVLINEFGAAGLDAALLQGGAAAAAAAAPAAGAAAGSAAAAAAAEPLPEGVHIKQLAGGCLCCALSSVTSLAIAQLLRNIKPDRCAPANSPACFLQLGACSASSPLSFRLPTACKRRRRT